jgi:hypothetical protein
MKLLNKKYISFCHNNDISVLQDDIPISFDATDSILLNEKLVTFVNLD